MVQIFKGKGPITVSANSDSFMFLINQGEIRGVWNSAPFSGSSIKIAYTAPKRPSPIR